MRGAKNEIPSGFAIVASIAILLAAASTFAGAAAGGAPPPPLFAPEKGSFRILVNGQQIGKEEFEIGQNGGNWVAKGNSEIQTADGATRVSGSLELHADGTPVSYEWSTQGAKKAGATISFSGPTATIELRLDGRRPFTQQFT